MISNLFKSFKILVWILNLIFFHSPPQTHTHTHNRIIHFYINISENRKEFLSLYLYLGISIDLLISLLAFLPKKYGKTTQRPYSSIRRQEFTTFWCRMKINLFRSVNIPIWIREINCTTNSYLRDSRLTR